MSKVVLIDPLEDPRWDRFVESHPFGWICHLSGWKQALESTFHHMKGYHFALMDDAGERIEAGLPVFHVRSWILGDRLVSVPFATLCDPLVENKDQFQQLVLAVHKLAETLNARWIEVRTLHSSHLLRSSSWGESNAFKVHCLELKEGCEEILKRFRPKSVRYSIRRAAKHQLQLKEDEPGNLSDFFALHMRIRQDQGLPLHPFRWFESFWRVFAPSGRLSIVAAGKNNVTIGVLLLFKFKDRVSVDYSASDKAFAEMMPNHFLYWNAIQMACREGFKTFDFGRTSTEHRNLMDFKSRWGTSAMDLPQFFHPKEHNDPASPKSGSAKYKFLHTACRHSPEFARKAIGEFCYRHMG